MIVYCDGKRHIMSVAALKKTGWNALVNKTNGYSHDWQESVQFDEKYIEKIGGVRTIWCTKKEIGFIPGTSSVSFS